MERSAIVQMFTVPNMMRQLALVQRATGSLYALKKFISEQNIICIFVGVAYLYLLYITYV